MIVFHGKDELDKLYQEMKQKPYERKEPWEKFLSDDISRNYQKKKRIREYEIPFGEMKNL